MNTLKGKTVLVTGATGFLGKWIMKELEKQECKEVTGIGYSKFWNSDSYSHNLISQQDVNSIINKNYRGPSWDYVLHLAGYNGGIKKNIDEPAKIFYENSMMALNLIDSCRKYKVGKFIGIVASCGYPEEPQFLEVRNCVKNGNLIEEDFLGYDNPNKTVQGHGFAKRNMQIACSLYKEQYGMNAITVCPTTLYGQGQNYSEKDSKIVGAMIKRFVDAVDNKQEEVSCWGDGTPLREVLYVEDAARMIVLSMTEYNDSRVPLNLGSGQEYTIKEIAEAVANQAGFKGIINWENDDNKPNGQKRKRLNIDKMKKILGSESISHSFWYGIRVCIEDYKKRKYNGEFE